MPNSDREITLSEAETAVHKANSARASLLSTRYGFNEYNVLAFLEENFGAVTEVSRETRKGVLEAFLLNLEAVCCGDQRIMWDFEGIKPECDEYELIGRSDLAEAALLNQVARIRSYVLILISNEGKKSAARLTHNILHVPCAVFFRIRRG